MGEFGGFECGEGRTWWVWFVSWQRERYKQRRAPWCANTETGATLCTQTKTQAQQFGSCGLTPQQPQAPPMLSSHAHAQLNSSLKIGTSSCWHIIFDTVKNLDELRRLHNLNELLLVSAARSQHLEDNARLASRMDAVEGSMRAVCNLSRSNQQKLTGSCCSYRAMAVTLH